MGDIEQFETGMRLLLDRLSFNQDRNVSVFETNIRVLGKKFPLKKMTVLTGGLLSIHVLATEFKDQLTYPYHNQALQLARELADKLMPAFETPTGIPFSRVNLQKGLILGDTAETCTAGAGTLIMEFGLLSKLTGNPKYEVQIAIVELTAPRWPPKGQYDRFGEQDRIWTWWEVSSMS